MLDLLTTSTRVLTLPLPSDPALIDANPVEALALYYATGDADALVIPPACLMVQVRALSSAEKRAAHEAAGRPSMRGEQIHEQGNAADDPAAFFDALTDADYSAVIRYLAWSRRLNAEVVKRACVDFNGAPGAALVEAVSASPSERGEGVILEIAGLIARVGSLGKATPPHSVTWSGAASSMPAAASSATDATAPSPSGLPATA